MENEDAFLHFVDIAINKMFKLSDTLIFATCFSEKGDLLSQWRSYADNGRGVSIGFNLKCLEDICTSTSLLRIEKITYSDSDKCKDIVYNYAREIINNIIEAIVNKEIRELVMRPEGDLNLYLTQQSLVFDDENKFIKDSSFQQEEEWRLILDDELLKTDDDWDEKYKGNNELFPNSFQFRSIRNDVISFIDLFFGKYKEKIISKIIIGPNCILSRNDVFHVLSCNGFNLDYDKIIKSKSSFVYRD